VQEATSMGDEEELAERNRDLIRDRKEQAGWYESLNLYAEALRIYSSIKDDENVSRLRKKMALAGDLPSVKRMKDREPSLVILYDEKAGGLSQLGTDLAIGAEAEEKDAYFDRPNEGTDGVDKSTSDPRDVAVRPQGRTGLPVRMPVAKQARFCPYCGERIVTKKEPRFCPSCGEEL